MSPRVVSVYTAASQLACSLAATAATVCVGGGAHVRGLFEAHRVAHTWCCKTTLQTIHTNTGTQNTHTLTVRVTAGRLRIVRVAAAHHARNHARGRRGGIHGVGQAAQQVAAAGSGAEGPGLADAAAALALTHAGALCVGKSKEV